MTKSFFKNCFWLFVLVISCIPLAQAQVTNLGAQSGTNGGSSATYIGYRTGRLATGSGNTFIGSSAGSNHTIGFQNTFLGFNAGLLDTSGRYNVFLGSSAGLLHRSGTYNVFIGSSAGSINNGLHNTFVGGKAGALATGGYNTFLGYEAGASTTGAYNVFSGYGSGTHTSGSHNIILGFASGSYTSGSRNVILGHQAGENTPGSQNVFIGHKAGTSESGSNKLYIANSAGPPLVYGDFVSKRVGINTNNPLGTFEVFQPNGVANLNIQSGVANFPAALRFYNGAKGYEQQIGFIQVNEIGTINNPRMTLSVGGNTILNLRDKKVGLLTANPAAQFHIYNPDQGASVLRIQGGPGGIGASPSQIEFWGNPVNTSGEWRPGIIKAVHEEGFKGGLAFFTNGVGEEQKTTQMEVMRLINGKVGIGTTTPVAQLDVYNASEGAAVLRIQGGPGGISNSPSQIEFWGNPRSSNSEWRPGIIKAVHENGYKGGLAFFTNGVGEEQKTTQMEVMRLINGKIGIGTTLEGVNSSELEGFKLFVTEGIKAEKVRVQLAAGRWADYVFKADYQLRSLQEVEAHIKQKGHLPDVPSAKEVGQKGINLGEMDATLLRKIEELTLYVIQIKKQSEQLKQQNEQLKKRIDQLEKK